MVIRSFYSDASFALRFECVNMEPVGSLYVQHVQRLREKAVVRLSSEADRWANDLVQDVFEQLTLAYNNAQVHPCWVNWLDSALENRLDKFLTQEHYPVTSTELIDEKGLLQLEEDSSVSLAESHYQSSISRLNFLIGFLSPRKKYVLEGYRLEEKSWEQLAQELNVTPLTVRYYYKQAIQQLMNTKEMFKATEPTWTVKFSGSGKKV